MAGCTVQKSTAGRSHRHTLEASGLSLWSKTGVGVGESRTSKNPPTPSSPKLNLRSSSSLPLYPLPFNTLLSTVYPLPQLSVLPLTSTLPSFPHSPLSPLSILTSPFRLEPSPTPSPSFDPFYTLLLPPQSFPLPQAHFPYPSPAPRVSSPSAPPSPRPQPRPHELRGEPRRRHHPQRPPSRALQKGREGGDVS